MTTIVTKQPVSLSVASPVFSTAPVAIDPLTSEITLRVSRSTTVTRLTWAADTKVNVALIVFLDGTRYECVGTVSGGIRTRRDGVEANQYVLVWTLPWGFFGARSGTAKRLGETRGGIYTAHVELTLLSGTVAVTDVEVISIEEPAPQVPFRSSVAFDAAALVEEIAGDGVLSTSFTSAGSDRAVFCGISIGAEPPTPTSSSCTYGGTGMTEMWDEPVGSGGSDYRRHAGYRLAGQATGSQTVTSTLSGALDEHILGIISMTGVDQTTPVGTPVTQVALTGTTSTVTVSSVGADDLVVDNLNHGAVTPTIGADQTQRYTNTSGDVQAKGSTQPGSAGGVMSWTHSSTEHLLGAVVFKAAAGAADNQIPTRRLFPISLYG